METNTQTQQSEIDLDIKAREIVVFIIIDGEVYELTFDDLVAPTQAVVKEQVRRALTDTQTEMVL